MGNRPASEPSMDGSNTTLQNPTRRTRRFSGSLEGSGSREMKCPTCHGKGTVTIKEGEDAEQLIALIPYKDNRLKPRRTVRNVVITIVICAVISGLLLFFLLPRSVTIALSENPKPFVSSVSLLHYNHTVEMGVHFGVVIKNKNFLSVKLSKLTATLLQNALEVGGIIINESLSVGSLKSQVHNFSLALTFSNGQGLNIERLCAGDWRHYFFELMFEINGYYSYFSDDEVVTVSKFAQLNVFNKCSSK
ncbi:transmembrane protein 106B-like [Oscarella lobularis]|uniref:transmembrane protein 106B-like n=1 Tax=Oscarella lobularis TaxID=121494 RepID=UPI0033134D7A